jgi:hypothetical protein
VQIISNLHTAPGCMRLLDATTYSLKDFDQVPVFNVRRGFAQELHKN